MQKNNKMSHGNMKKLLKSFPPALYFISSLGILIFFFLYDFRFSNTIHSILYVVFMLVNVPVGLGIFFYTYSYWRTYEPGRPPIFPGLSFLLENLLYGIFILLGCVHLILFVYLLFIFILNGFSIPQPIELQNLRDLIRK